MAKAGSPATVQRLVEDHYASLYRYAYRLTGSSADAEDLTQETFCKAQRNFGQLRDAERSRGWLFTILRNAFIERVNESKQHPSVPLEWAGDVAEPLPEPLPDLDPERLQAALSELPVDYRMPIILFYFEGFGYKDIAEHLEVPIGTVMSRLSRAKAHLRGRLVPAEPVSAGGPASRRANDGL